MKKIVSFVLFLSGFTFSAFSQAPMQGSPVPEESAEHKDRLAEITFESLDHDYGTIKNGANGVYEFKFKNTGKEPLIISNARGSCGCTVPEWPKQPIKPGESGVLKVSYDTKRNGPFSKTVTVNSNAKTDPLVLNIKGVVQEPAKEETSPVKKVEEGATPLANPVHNFK